MPTTKVYYAKAAAQFGNINPNDSVAVNNFFVNTLPTLPKETRDKVVRFLLNQEGKPGDVAEDSPQQITQV